MLFIWRAVMECLGLWDWRNACAWVREMIIYFGRPHTNWRIIFKFLINGFLGLGIEVGERNRGKWYSWDGVVVVDLLLDELWIFLVAEIVIKARSTAHLLLLLITPCNTTMLQRKRLRCWLLKCLLFIIYDVFYCEIAAFLDAMAAKVSHIFHVVEFYIWSLIEGVLSQVAEVWWGACEVLGQGRSCVMMRLHWWFGSTKEGPLRIATKVRITISLLPMEEYRVLEQMWSFRLRQTIGIFFTLLLLI